jgi:hypothetical protein
MAKLQATVRSGNMRDAHALGFLVEAGRQAFVEDPNKEQKATAAAAGRALQISLAVGLGAGNPAIAATLGITSKVVDGAFRGALGRLSQEALGALIAALGQSTMNEKQRWESMHDQLRLRLQGTVDAAFAFGQGRDDARNFATR